MLVQPKHILSLILLATSASAAITGVPAEGIKPPTNSLKPRSFDDSSTSELLIQPMIGCETEDFNSDVSPSEIDFENDCFETSFNIPPPEEHEIQDDEPELVVLDIVQEFDPTVFDASYENFDPTACDFKFELDGNEAGFKCIADEQERQRQKEQEKEEFYNRVSSPEAWLIDEEEEQGFGLGGIFKRIPISGMATLVDGDGRIEFGDLEKREPLDLSQIAIDLAKDLYMNFNYNPASPPTSSNSIPDSPPLPDAEANNIDPPSPVDRVHTNTPVLPPQMQENRDSVRGARRGSGDDAVGSGEEATEAGEQVGRVARPNTPALRQVEGNRG